MFKLVLHPMNQLFFVVEVVSVTRTVHVQMQILSVTNILKTEMSREKVTDFFLRDTFRKSFG